MFAISQTLIWLGGTIALSGCYMAVMGHLGPRYPEDRAAVADAHRVSRHGMVAAAAGILLVLGGWALSPA